MRRSSLILVAAAVIVAVIGCKPKKKEASDDPDASFLEDGTDSTAAESDAQVLTSTLVAAAPDGTISLASVNLSGSDLTTRDIGAGAKAIFFPKDCVTATNDAAARIATYKFVGCMGPNGLRAVTGEIQAKYALEPNHLHLELTATDLSINNATIDWAATADITSAGGNRTMIWKASLSGVTAGGREITRTNDVTVHWNLGEACFELDGVSEGTIKKGDGEAREIRTDISDFRRCRRGCPDPGGKITVTNVSKGKKIELRYDGSNRATFTAPNGTERTIPLLCRP